MKPPSRFSGYGVSQLWRDSYLRGVSLQILFVAVLFAAIAWLISNVVVNFAALDKTFGFSFLWELEAGYDINQALIEYNSRNSHLRAAFIGLINTGLVAVVGIVLATVLGFAIGIMRLSDNWLISRIAYVFVEFTRNTPVLLLILLWHGIIINLLPHPRSAIALGETAFLSNRGFFIPRPHFEPGIWIVAAAAAIAIVGAILVFRYARRVQNQTGRQLPAAWISLALVVCVPVAAYLAAGSPVSFEYPVFRGFNFRGGIQMIPEFVALTWALAFYTAGFIAENVRAGILAVSKGQIEASRSLGLSKGRMLQLVVLPQALRVIIPPLTSSYLDLTKNSSLAIAIGYMDLVATLGGITLNQTGREMETMMLVMVIYLVISLAISVFMNWYNHRVRLVER